MPDNVLSVLKFNQNVSDNREKVLVPRRCRCQFFHWLLTRTPKHACLYENP